MSRKKYHDDTIKQNKKIDQRSMGPLFSDVHAKSVDSFGYTSNHGSPRTDRSMRKHSIPSDSIYTDESVVNPASSLNSYRQHDSKPYTNAPSNYRHERERVRLPPTIHQRQPYEYVYVQPDYRHSEHLYYSPSMDRIHQSFHDHQHEETYDPRWWYMPINSVHGPKYRRSVDPNLYVPPKWYELPSKR